MPLSQLAYQIILRPFPFAFLKKHGCASRDIHCLFSLSRFRRYQLTRFIVSVFSAFSKAR